MKKYKLVLAFAIVITANFLFGQGPSFYDLSFQSDSITSPYKMNGTNYVFVRSKRGTSGVNTTSSADSIKSFNISKIVLVYTEVAPSDIENREEYNQERWENLIMTYPEFFQAKTVYQNMCQCSENAGGDEFKSVQGFYIYYVAKGGGATAVKKTEAPAVKVETVVKTEHPAETKKAEVPVTKTEVPVTKTESPVVKSETPVAKTEVKVEETKKEVVKDPELTAEESTNTSETTIKKKSNGAIKPKRAKDSKACRSSCYGSGDDDLNSFFKDNITLTKKQKKKWKSASSELKLQLNFDGSIKKAMVAGANADLNKLVLASANAMNSWNAAVKNGLTIKSEVRITLKFDKETKAFKPFEIIVNPRLNAKCKCLSDSELFGDN